MVSILHTFLKGKGKLSHHLETWPKIADPRFDVSDDEDSMIMAWLLNSMLPEISDTCMFVPNVKDIWEAIK